MRNSGSFLIPPIISRIIRFNSPSSSVGFFLQTALETFIIFLALVLLTSYRVAILNVAQIFSHIKSQVIVVVAFVSFFFFTCWLIHVTFLVWRAISYSLLIRNNREPLEDDHSSIYPIQEAFDLFCIWNIRSIRKKWNYS